MDSPELNRVQKIIIALLSKYKPELVFTIEMGEENIPEIVLEYGIVSTIPEDADPSTLITTPQKYKIPLNDAATWDDIKKWIDIFEKYLKNADLNKKPVIDASAQIQQLEYMKKLTEEMNANINKNKK